MTQTVSDVMTPNPRTLPATATVLDAARTMRDADIGPVIVMKNGNTVCGIVTDRDIAVRAVAEGLDPANTKIDEICSHDVTAVSPGDDVGDAVQLMVDKAIRRLPVVENGKPVGIVSIGDLAIELDSESALADISARPPNQ